MIDEVLPWYPDRWYVDMIDEIDMDSDRSDTCARMKQQHEAAPAPRLVSSSHFCPGSFLIRVFQLWSCSTVLRGMK